MRRRYVALPAWLVLGVLALVACYDPPRPACGFRCGAGGACPADYTCGSDNYCHLVGSPSCGIPMDAPADAPPIDPPFIVETVPMAGAIDVSVGTVVTARFSEDIVGANTSTFQLRSSGTPIAGTVSYAADTFTATFAPAEQLPERAFIIVTLTPGIRDAEGNGVPLTELDFTTAGDDIPPRVKATAPPSGATVAPTTPIVIVFDERVREVTVASFTVDAGSGPVAGTITTANDGREATFTPAAPLPAATQVTVTLTADILDLAGNRLVAHAFTFTTS